MRKIIWILLIIAVLGVFFAFSLKFKEQTSDRILLLYPEGANPVLLEAWKNIAAEEGLHLDTLPNNDFIYTKKIGFANQYRGIILSDKIQTQMPKILSDRIKSYVKDGGRLLLIFDAGTQDERGNLLKNGSWFSDVLNLKYNVAKKADGIVTELGSAGQSRDILNTLGIPPGKCVLDNMSSKIGDQASNSYCAISSYGYGPLKYYYYLTQPINDINDLLLTTADHQFIAGVKNFNQGKILFVNLPLMDLWLGTDAMLLHAFLHYFAVDMMHLPMLSPVPNGVGGIILNLHVESNDALDGFSVLEKWGLFQQGPYSIDFTAGPDLDKLGDNNGMDVLHNTLTQSWMNRLAKLGNAIGSDGGWAHNYYALNANENNQSEFQKYLSMNNDAIEKVLGKKVLEYVPPNGNQPAWATRYLEKEGFLAYYTTSNTGTAPTQNFRDGVFDSPHLWSFPILPFGPYACIRDFGFVNLPAESVSQWFLESTDFVASHHTSHLIYFHPTDINYFPQYLYSIQAWLLKTKELSDLGSFHWYSMIDIAEFLNSRRNVTWNVEIKDSVQMFSAAHPDTLEHQAWLIDKNTCDRPTISKGAGNIKEDAKSWIVIAGKTKRLEFRCNVLSAENKPVQATVVPKNNSINVSSSSIAPFVWHHSGLVTLWFDDAATSEFTQVLPVMEEYGYKAAVSITVNNVGKPGYMTWDQLSTLQTKGWETTSHSLSNTCNLAYYTTAATENELLKSKQMIMQHGLRANQFVMPCGYSRDQIAAHFIDKHPPIVETAEKYYASFRTLTSKRDNPLPLLNRYNLKAFQVTSTTTDKEIQDRLDLAVNDKSWLIFVFQEINENSQMSSVSLERFRSILGLINNSHLPVVLPEQVMAINQASP